jgi:PAS domain S-box-containing protein
MTTPPVDEWLNCLLPLLSDPVCILDTNLRVRYTTPSFLALMQDQLADVMDQPADLAFMWNGSLKGVPDLLNQVLESSEGVEVSFKRPGVDVRGEGASLKIQPIRAAGQDSPVTGLLLMISTPTMDSPIWDQQSHSFSLMNIIHEITTSDQVLHPTRMIQQVVSRVGSLLQVSFISFLEFPPDNDCHTSPQETYLWSQKSGFLVGGGWDDIVTPETSELTRFRLELSWHTHLIYVPATAPGVIRRTMLQRNVSHLLIIPVLYGKEVHGCFFLWGTEDSWTRFDITAFESIGRIVGAAMTKARIEADLARSQEKFRGVIEHIGDMYYRTDKAGVLLEISPSMGAALGYPVPDHLTGISMENLLMNPDVWPIFLSEVLNGDGVKDYELILKGARGKIIIGSVSCRLIYNKEGDLQGIEGVIRDISRRRQYEQLVQESEWKLEQAQKIAKLGIWSYDSIVGSFRVSPEVFSILVLPLEKNEIILEDLIQIASASDKALFIRHFQDEALNSEDFAFDFRIDLPHKKFKYIRIQGHPRMRDDLVTGSFGILQDITERKEVEQHLLKYANQLELKTFELDAMKNQLLDINRDLDQRVRARTIQIEELLRQKDEFIMQIGHDLKTPLTPLVAILPYIRKKTTDPELTELLDVSIDDVKSIKKMITTILELAQMNALYSLSDLQQINLHEAFDQIIADNAYLIHQKSLTIKNAIPNSYSIMMSPMHLETLTSNLIGNAVKYSYIDGSILISATEQPEAIYIKIQDFGIGVEPDVLPRIFDEFFKADSSRHDRDSHGLGLAIVRRIVDIYGGVIRAESEGLGRGSTFYMNLKKKPRFRNSADSLE